MCMTEPGFRETHFLPQKLGKQNKIWPKTGYLEYSPIWTNITKPYISRSFENFLLI